MEDRSNYKISTLVQFHTKDSVYGNFLLCKRSLGNLLCFKFNHSVIMNHIEIELYMKSKWQMCEGSNDNSRISIPCATNFQINLRYRIALPS